MCLVSLCGGPENAGHNWPGAPDAGFEIHPSKSLQVTTKTVKAFSIQAHGFFDNIIPQKT